MVHIFYDQPKGAGALMDLAEQELPGGMSGIYPDGLFVDSDAVDLGRRYLLSALSVLADVDFVFYNVFESHNYLNFGLIYSA
jgi:hypothetical protein